VKPQTSDGSAGRWHRNIRGSADSVQLGVVTLRASTSSGPSNIRHIGGVGYLAERLRLPAKALRTHLHQRAPSLKAGAGVWAISKDFASPIRLEPLETPMPACDQNWRHAGRCSAPLLLRCRYCLIHSPSGTVAGIFDWCWRWALLTDNNLEANPRVEPRHLLSLSQGRRGGPGALVAGAVLRWAHHNWAQGPQHRQPAMPAGPPRLPDHGFGW